LDKYFRFESRLRQARAIPINVRGSEFARTSDEQSSSAKSTRKSASSTTAQKHSYGGNKRVKQNETQRVMVTEDVKVGLMTTQQGLKTTKRRAVAVVVMNSKKIAEVPLNGAGWKVDFDRTVNLKTYCNWEHHKNFVSLRDR
uniref:Reverse transcriptase domain-containing protein n=1 Tax=Ascaris lumbricoides TaxID=6252 RepID=A0A0M3IKC0_ASCLU